MAPKRPVANPSKRGRTGAGSSSRSGHGFDDFKFKSEESWLRFQQLEGRKIWPEVIFDVSPNGPYQRFVEIIEGRGWGKLISPRKNYNADLVREFYANALHMEEDEMFPYTTMVRGKPIRFDRDTINDYLGN
ncbi:hypothetical protein A2U01_0011791, partial [Trifolium medium]|nr:hypothetical protein [Trifolium medium]